MRKPRIGRPKKPCIGRWPDEDFYPRGPQRWYAMFPDTPLAYTPCSSWPEALAVVARWYAKRDAKET